VSRLCLGTMNFGPETTEEDSHAIMDRALDLGINFFDTANVYGWKKGEGITEQIVGRWFASGGDRRDKTVIATKLYGGMSDWPNDTFLSARNIRHAVDDGRNLVRPRTRYNGSGILAKTFSRRSHLGAKISKALVQACQFGGVERTVVVGDIESRSRRRQLQTENQGGEGDEETCTQAYRIHIVFRKMGFVQPGTQHDPTDRA
jgi:hypothetical protein